MAHTVFGSGGVTVYSVDKLSADEQLKQVVYRLNAAKNWYKSAEKAALKITDPQTKKLAEQYLSGEITP